MSRRRIALRTLPAAVAGLALGAAGCGGNSTTAGSAGSGTGGNISHQRADAEAKAGALMAMTAMEAYATDYNGAYTGASASLLRKIEPRIPENVEVRAAQQVYRITVPSAAGGNSFSISREASGTTRRMCEVPGEGGCPPSGDWG